MKLDTALSEVQGAKYEGRVGIIQRVLPLYRVAFFNLLAQACTRGLSVASGQPLSSEGIVTGGQSTEADFTPLRNRHVFRGAAYVCWQSGIDSWLRDWNPDVLIVEANPRLLSTRRAISWMERRGRRVIGWGLGTRPSSSTLPGLRGWCRASFLRRLSAVIAYSTKAAEEYRAAGIDPARIFVARNAVRRRPLTSLHLPKANIDGQGRIISVGRLVRQKRLDILLRACAQLPVGQRPTITLVGDGAERETLTALASDLGLNVLFRGDLRGDALAREWQLADLFVLPGTGGLAIQEALSHSLPVIVAGGDGTETDLVSSRNGWLVTPGSVEALNVAIVEALRDRHRLIRLGEESLRIATEEVNLEAMCQSFIRAMRYCNQ